MVALLGGVKSDAQKYIDFRFDCFSTTEDASFDEIGYQRYYMAGFRERPADAISDDPSWMLYKYSPLFNTNFLDNGTPLRVKAAFMRNDVMYVSQTREDNHINRLAVLTSTGEFKDFIDFPTSDGYIFHLAYVPAEDNVYFVVQGRASSNSWLYKAKGSDLRNWEVVGSICASFDEKPYSFTYSETHNKFFYVSFDSKLYSMSLTGEKELLYAFQPNSFPSPTNNRYSNTRPEIGSGLVWAEEYEMLLWCCPRANVQSGPGTAKTFVYGLPVEKGSTPVLVDNGDSLGKNVINVMITNGFKFGAGIPKTPSYLSCYDYKGTGVVCGAPAKDSGVAAAPAYVSYKKEPGYYSLAWPVVREDTEGNPIEEDVYYDVRIVGEDGGLLETRKNPEKGSTTGINFIMPDSYTASTFYVSVQARTSAGASGVIECGPNVTFHHPFDKGEFLEPNGKHLPPTFDPKSGSTLTIGEADITITSPANTYVAYIINSTEEVTPQEDFTIAESNVVTIGLESSSTIKAYTTNGNADLDSSIVEAVYIVESSSVEEISAEYDNAEIYTVNGVRVTGVVTPGLYIIVRPDRQAAKVIIK